MAAKGVFHFEEGYMGGPGSGGHNRKNAAQHRVSGTFRPDRHTPPTGVQPPAADDVETPQALSAPACEEWRPFVATYHLSGNLTALVGLEAYCRAFDRHRQAREVIDRDGIVLTGARGGQRAHPLLRVEHTAAMDMQRALRNLRLDEMATPPEDGAEFDSPLAALQRKAAAIRRV
jgi:P27 family predicted phage terminase small subunit